MFHFDFDFDFLKTQILTFTLNAFFNISYNLIKLYSIVQIRFFKLTKISKQFLTNCSPRLKEFLDDYSSRSKKHIPMIECILDGDVLFEMSMSDFHVKNKQILQNNTNVIFVYSEYNNKKIVNDLENVDLCCKGSKIKFISSSITIKGNTKQVEFKNENYNYFIVGNVFETGFIRFFLKSCYPNFYNELINSCNFNESSSFNDFQINAIDNEANIVLFDSNNILKIEEDRYSIIKKY